MRLAAVPVMALIVAVAAPFLAAPASLARFTDVDGTAASLATGALAAPTSLAGTGGTFATLTWTPSTSTAATGYQVLRSGTSGSGHAQIGTVTPVSAAAATDSPGNGTWYYVLRTYLQGWTSPSSNEASVIVSTTASTGFKGCTTTAAVTTGSGDNNGYESNPGRACGLDGAEAVDASSGTNTVISCSNAGKDRHVFWGYALNVPANASSIVGITVQATAGLNNNGGTSVMCVQLSSNGGATWTTEKTVSFSSASLTTYVFGGATDTWGVTWAPSGLSTTNLRVRVTDVSSQANKDFRLDDLAVEVHYTP